MLGEGASAVVYAAHDVLLDRPVALKIPRLPLGAEAGAAERIAQEVRTAARLHDWHIVTIFDVVEDYRRPMIVMERVNGRTLAALLRERGSLPLAEAVAIGEQIARALAAAHAGGIIHRDVKPSNVLVSDAGAVKLTDFGIARALANEQARLTQTGMIVGSVFYLAPELMAGAEPTPAVDLYALGAITYQMLCGAPPFGGSDPVTIALAHATQPVPSVRGIPGIPLALARLIEKLLAKTPADRPADAGGVADEFAACAAALAATDPLTAPTVTVASPAPRRRTNGLRRRLVAPLALVACIGLVAIARVAWPHDVVVPSVSGAADAAEKRLTTAGLRVARVTASSESAPNGAVIRQDPLPGAHLSPGSAVRLYVSTGLPVVTVPNVLGRDATAAAAAVRATGLQLATTSRVSDDPADTIVQQVPAGGAQLREHQTIVAVVSTGPQVDADEDGGRGRHRGPRGWAGAWCGGRASSAQLERDKREIDSEQRQVDEEFDGSDPRYRDFVKGQLEAEKQALDAQERQADQERRACESSFAR